MGEESPIDPVREAIADTAAAWVLRCDRGLTAIEQDEFSQWLASDPRHGEQLARHRRHWNRLETLAVWRPEHSARPNPDLLAPPRSRAVRWLPAIVALAAAAAFAIAFLRPDDVGVKPPSAPVATERAAAVATVTQRVLDDGTVVELNRGAIMTVRFTAAERRVRLEQGEAHFRVTKNPARPFVVSAHGMDVHAVGTAFNVRLDTAVVEVLVTEGRVQVSRESETSPGAFASPTPARPPVVPMLEAGQRAVVSLAAQPEAPQIALLTAGEIERVLAWQHRMLDFTAAPLADVVAEFNRHNTTQIVVADPELASVRISASFRSDNLDGFVRLVEVGSIARVERRSDHEILLRKAR